MGMTKTEINHQTEAMIADNHGHELGCFEQLAEELLEELAEQGTAYETGALTEVIEGVTVLDRIVARLVKTERCHCEAQEEE